MHCHRVAFLALKFNRMVHHPRLTPRRLSIRARVDKHVMQVLCGESKAVSSSLQILGCNAFHKSKFLA
eukprot:524158-Rhodomonas_salina.3